ncbi:MAG: methyltransferase domain-containing protein [Planctomycetota bacterium]
MPHVAGEAGLCRLYDNLARYHWLRRRLAACAPGEGLELHKRLVAPPSDTDGPPAGTAGLHDWLWQQLGAPPAPTVLDVGCGFGASVLRWATTQPGTFVGLGASAYQVQRARREAERAGVADRCSFVLQSYDQPIAGPFDRVVAVEALLHAQDLAATLANVAAAMAPGARLVAVEDVAADDAVAADPDAAELLQRWSTAGLPSLATWRRACAAAGLHVERVHDLTAQVQPRPASVLARSERRLKALRRAMPVAAARAVLDAFLGGIALERLYAKGATRYVVVAARLEAGGAA